MAVITNIRAREIIDSRGNPTIEADVVLSDGSIGTAAVPSGASTGQFEALELRDGNGTRYGGKGVLSAIRNIHETILPVVEGTEATDQRLLDRQLMELDGTENKSILGANAILAVSLANAKAAAASGGVPLYKYLNGSDEFIIPVPLLNIINGGKHADNSTDIQEFMIVPAGFNYFADAIRAGCEIYHSLEETLKSQNLNTSVGDEGGFAPSLPSNQAALDLIVESVTNAGYEIGNEIYIALDTAAAELFDAHNATYHLKREGDDLTGKELIALYTSWVNRYPIISIEDGLSEDEWGDWQSMMSTIGSEVQLVGDDLLTTNPNRIERGLLEKCANAVLIKPNQIGTLSETLDAIDLARTADWGTIMSHRSGETEDYIIADLSVGTATGQIKTGAPARGERTAKYNRLIRIEEELGDRCSYAGKQVYEKYL